MARRLKKPKKVEKHMDYSLLLVIIALVAFGFVMLYSTSVYTATVKYGDGMLYLRKQAIACALGFAGMFVVVKFGYKFVALFCVPIYFIAFILCVAVNFIGSEINGSTRWIVIGGLSIQPSEIAKFALILFFAVYINKNKVKLTHFKYVFFASLYGFFMFAAIAINNLSTAIIVYTIVLIMLFVAYDKILPFIWIGLGGLLVLTAYLLVASYRIERVQIWLNPENYSKGYQILQGLYAIGSGGLFGKGLGESIQKLGYVPEAQNDMIFSIVCEELGVAGGVVVILMFLMLLWRLYQIAIHANTMVGGYIAVGILAHISLQVVLNIAVVTNSIPNTGVTLPFISYGGTSVAVLLTEMGLALSVSKDLKPEEEW